MGFKDLVPQLEKKYSIVIGCGIVFVMLDLLDMSYLTFDLLFRENLEATYSSTWISKVAGLMTGWLAGCCIERNAWNIPYIFFSIFWFWWTVNNCLYILRELIKLLILSHLYRLDFGVIASVCHGLSLSCHSTCSHPSGILWLLNREISELVHRHAIVELVL